MTLLSVICCLATARLHVPAATNTHATIEEMLDAVSSVLSMLYVVKTK
jgi:hypothetical protein